MPDNTACVRCGKDLPPERTHVDTCGATTADCITVTVVLVDDPVAFRRLGKLLARLLREDRVAEDRAPSTGDDPV